MKCILMKYLQLIQMMRIIRFKHKISIKKKHKKFMNSLKKIRRSQKRLPHHLEHNFGRKREQKDNIEELLEYC